MYMGEIYNIGCDGGMEFGIGEIAILLIRLIKGDSVQHGEWIVQMHNKIFHYVKCHN